MNTTKERTAANGKAITKKGDPYTLYKLQSESAITTSIQINVNNRCTPESSFEFVKLIKLLLTMGKVMLFPYNWNRIVCAGLVRSVTTGSRIP